MTAPARQRLEALKRDIDTVHAVASRRSNPDRDHTQMLLRLTHWSHEVAVALADLGPVETPPDNEELMLMALSDALTGGNAGTWEEVLHAARTRSEPPPPDLVARYTVLPPYLAREGSAAMTAPDRQRLPSDYATGYRDGQQDMRCRVAEVVPDSADLIGKLPLLGARTLDERVAAAWDESRKAVQPLVDLELRAEDVRSVMDFRMKVAARERTEQMRCVDRFAQMSIEDRLQTIAEDPSTLQALIDENTLALRALAVAREYAHEQQQAVQQLEQAGEALIDSYGPPSDYDEPYRSQWAALAAALGTTPPGGER